MNLQAIKEQFAKDCGYNDWKDFLNSIDHDQIDDTITSISAKHAKYEIEALAKKTECNTNLSE